jgi:hypothetical protein
MRSLSLAVVALVALGACSKQQAPATANAAANTAALDAVARARANATNESGNALAADRGFAREPTPAANVLAERVHQAAQPAP